MLISNKNHTATLRSGTLVPRVKARVVYDTLSNTCCKITNFF